MASYVLSRYVIPVPPWRSSPAPRDRELTHDHFRTTPLVLTSRVRRPHDPPQEQIGDGGALVSVSALRVSHREPKH